MLNFQLSNIICFSYLRLTGGGGNLIGMKAIPFLLFLAAFNLAGAAMEKKLEAIVMPKVGALEGYTLAATLQAFNAAFQSVDPKAGVQLRFASPFAKPAINLTNINQQLVRPVAQPARPGGGFGGRGGVDPTTGLRLPGGGGGIRGGGIVPNTGFPFRLGASGGRQPQPARGQRGGVTIDPSTGLPIGNPGGRLPSAVVRPNRGMQIPQHGALGANGQVDSTRAFIRNWRGMSLDQTGVDIVTRILNTSTVELRCIIDGDAIVFVPEAVTYTLRSGKPAKPEYEERWVPVRVQSK